MRKWSDWQPRSRLWGRLVCWSLAGWKTSRLLPFPEEWVLWWGELIKWRKVQLLWRRQLSPLISRLITQISNSSKWYRELRKVKDRIFSQKKSANRMRFCGKKSNRSCFRSWCPMVAWTILCKFSLKFLFCNYFGRLHRFSSCYIIWQSLIQVADEKKTALIAIKLLSRKNRNSPAVQVFLQLGLQLLVFHLSGMTFMILSVRNETIEQLKSPVTGSDLLMADTFSFSCHWSKNSYAQDSFFSEKIETQNALFFFNFSTALCSLKYL